MRSDETARYDLVGLRRTVTLQLATSGVVAHPVIDTTAAASGAGSTASRACVSTS